MAVYLVGLSAGFCLGWLSHLRRTEVLRARRRGGYVKPPAFTLTSPATGTSATSLIRADFSSFDPPGPASAVAVLRPTPIRPSNSGALTLCGGETEDRGGNGRTRPEPAVCGSGCELPLGHSGPHIAIGPTIPASEGWAGGDDASA